jgi:hypothetical protein
MKFTFKNIKEYREHIDYIAQHPTKTNIDIHMILPKDVLRLDKIPFNIVAYLHLSSNDKNLHLCHKCNQLYPAHQYHKHAKESHK